eukprot:2603459-Pyramimonas_sp.AAC.1
MISLRFVATFCASGNDNLRAVNETSFLVGEMDFFRGRYAHEVTCYHLRRLAHLCELHAALLPCAEGCFGVPSTTGSADNALKQAIGERLISLEHMCPTSKCAPHRMSYAHALSNHLR